MSPANTPHTLTCPSHAPVPHVQPQNKPAVRLGQPAPCPGALAQPHTWIFQKKPIWELRKPCCHLNSAQERARVGCSEVLALPPTAGLLPVPLPPAVPAKGVTLPERALGRRTQSCFDRVLPGVWCRSASPCPSPPPRAPAGPEFPALAEQVPGRLQPVLASCRVAGVPIRCRERAWGAAGMADGVKLPRACHGLGQPSCRSPVGQGLLEGSSPRSLARQHPNASVQTW